MHNLKSEHGLTGSSSDITRAFLQFVGFVCIFNDVLTLVAKNDVPTLVAPSLI